MTWHDRGEGNHNPEQRLPPAFAYHSGTILTSPQTTGNAATEASVPAAWQSYSANSSQPSADTAASSWQKPA
eukprot:3421850-Amphidinium_carterae.1